MDTSSLESADGDGIAAVDSAADADPPDTALLTNVEHDLARVEQALADLESGDPGAAVAWISTSEPGNTRTP